MYIKLRSTDFVQISLTPQCQIDPWDMESDPQRAEPSLCAGQMRAETQCRPEKQRNTTILQMHKL